MLALGSISLANASLTFDVDTEKKGQFQIRSDGRIYVLEAPSQEAMMFWLQQLQTKRHEYNAKLANMTDLSLTKPATGLLGEEPLSSEDQSATNQSAASDILPHIRPPECVGEQTADKVSTSGISNWSIANITTEIRNHLSHGRGDGNLIRRKQSIGDRFSSPGISPNASPLITEKSPSNHRKSSPEEFPGKDCSEVATEEKSSNPHRRRSQSKHAANNQPQEDPTKSLNNQLRQATSPTHSTKEEIDSNENEQFVSGNSDEKQLLRLFENQQRINELQLNVKKAREEKEDSEFKLRVTEAEMKSLNDEISLVKEVLEAKDQVVVSLTEKLHQYENAPLVLTGDGAHPQPIVENNYFLWREKCAAFEIQNKFLNSEIIGLNEIQIAREKRTKQLESKLAALTARHCQIQRKYMMFLKNLSVSNEESKQLVDQLIKEAAESDSPSNNSLEKQYDMFGFLKNVDDDNALEKYTSQLSYYQQTMENEVSGVDVAIAKKWETVMVSLGGKSLPLTPEIKSLIRAGVPHEFRSKVWSSCVHRRVAKFRKSMVTDYYWRLVNADTNSYSLAINQIEMDLLRTLPNNKFYDSRSAEGIIKLRRILCAYSRHNPDIGYCQGMNRLAAVALLYLSEEEAFWCLIAIIDFIMPTEYYANSMLAAQADQRVLQELLTEKLPRLAAHFNQHGIELTYITLQWFLTVYIDNIPIQTVFRIWDCFLYEGDKILFRFAVAIFKIFEEHFLHLDSSTEILTASSEMSSKLWDVNKLMHAAFFEINPFPMNAITNKRVKHIAKLKVELMELEKGRIERVDSRTAKRPVDQYLSDEES
ncbi:uncharacterized protein TRIADDRAFT_51695 [Trichoplax adhaerens]|uniref:Rab-GAP TBC domain-containing protein n=1 Tax=Trichoplax adhaerens TaxID=10228 RepID=B3RKI7_TRIAD|nr:hypothetical protein TRIADDRAFT_51695 [Trichoplax adhaerens]EDV28607.1 hypothetical protein TRIADDRAFT_51695 [Trichoplax adhaerens]|eukprot:XP_002107809.1 hypothetical protein TRIADDRAFT_51695 [Trichoplax adhaerens]